MAVLNWMNYSKNICESFGILASINLSTPTQFFPHKYTSHLICRANHLADFYMTKYWSLKSHYQNKFEWNFIIVIWTWWFHMSSGMVFFTVLAVELLSKLLQVRSSHQRCSMKKGFLKNSQNSQEHTCARIWETLWHRCFLVNFAKFLRIPFLQNNLGRLLL